MGGERRDCRSRQAAGATAGAAFGTFQAGVATKGLELAAQVVRADAGFHADQAGRQVGESCLDLAARPPLPQHHRATVIQADHME
jgi:hypothetical protein